MAMSNGGRYRYPKNIRARKLIDKLTTHYDAADDGITEIFSYLVLKGFGRQMTDFILNNASQNLETLFSYIGDPTDILEHMRLGELEEVLNNYSKQMEVNTFIDSKNWNMTYIRDHMRWFDIHEVEYTTIGGQKDLSGKGDLQRYSSDLIRNAKHEVIIKSGDFDFVTPNSKPIEEGMLSGKDWVQLYIDAVDRGVNLMIMMNIDAAWTKKHAKILESTGATVKHMTNEWRVGIADGKEMFGFLRGPKDGDYKKIVGTSQVQLDKMFYIGYTTKHKPFVKRLHKDLHLLWDESTPAEKVYKAFEYNPDYE